MTELSLGPFSRVEGDLELRLTCEGGRVVAAEAATPLYRGIEQILEGRPAQDALVIAARLCGSCSVSQSMAAAKALGMAIGTRPPANGMIAANLILACETAADHLTHFYLSFMPDFADPAYSCRPWYALAVRRFQAQTGVAAREMEKARVAFLHAMGILAGRWPHNLAIQPGGTTKSIDLGERMRLLAVLADFRRFLETALYGDTLEAVAGLSSVADLTRWADAHGADGADLPLFLEIAQDLGLASLGRGPDRFLSVGAFGGVEDPLFPAGIWRMGAGNALDLADLREDLSHTWMSGPNLHPRDGTTLPDADKPGGYSWCKAVRLSGDSMEVGAFARQMIAGHPLIRSMAAAQGGRATVAGRVVARLLELAILVPAMERWVRSFAASEPYCLPAPVPERAEGCGLVEAARGSLGHWLAVEGGRIRRYQIVAPGTWNCSPRDSSCRPGPVEEALVGTPVDEGEAMPLPVRHIVRSFNLCLRCAAQ